ncbi:MAG: T9SS type A sorting domain-containing protein [Flavobacteriales bacterium]|nr:T9SS type A sorting domain-containing protein [Flavobacteriales bacterium]
MRLFTKLSLGLSLIFLSSTSFGQYCMPSANCSVGDGVEEFGMGPFLNTSGCSSDFGINGYADHTSLVVPVGQGNVETVVLRSGFANQFFSIWIDSDNSMSFEASELILMDEPVGLDQVTTTVTIPATIPFGDYIMRVQANYAGPSSTDPCTMGTFGETEDYTLNVGPPPSCIMVTDIQFDGISSSSVNVSWTDAGTSSAWDLEYGPAGFTPTGMPSPGYDDVSNPVMITGLDPATDFEVYVRADCGMDNTTDISFWSAPNGFTTECAPITPSYINDMNTFPFNCWEFANGGDIADGPQNFAFSNWFDGGFANDGFTGAQQVSFFGSNQYQWMLTPFFDLSGGTYQAEFDLALTQPFNMIPGDLGSDDFLAFLITQDFGTTWEVIQEWDMANPVPPSGIHTVHDLSAYTGAELQFAFLASSGVVEDFITFQFHIDNFIVQDLGACVTPFNVMANDISSNSAEISWTDPGASSAWDIEYGPVGFTPTGTPSPGYNDVTNPVIITGLNPITEYDVYVRADCGMDNTSDISYWLPATSFVTECASFVPFYANDFSNFDLDCWDFANGGDLSSGPLDFSFSNWFDNGFANFGFTGARSVTFFGGFNQSHWMFTPFFDLSSGTYQAEFDFSITQAFNQNEVSLGSDDAVAFVVSEDLGSTWNLIQWWDSSGVVTASGEHYIIDLSAFTGSEVRFAFWASNGAVDDFVQFQAHVDNFIVQDLGSPVAIQIDQTIDLGCGGDSSGVVLISVNGGSLPYSFLWDDGSTTEDLTGADAGEHYVTITDGTGITMMSDTVELFEPDPIVVDAIVTDESVNGANDGAIDITVSGGAGPYSFAWNNGSLDEDISGLIDALWCVNVTDIFGCETQACFTVMQGPSGLNAIEDLMTFSVFPNPISNDALNVEMVFGEKKNIQLQLLSAVGQELESRSFFNISDRTERFSLEHITSGMYFLRITDLDNNTQAIKKIVRE